MDGTPLGTVYHCHHSGCIQRVIFTEWFRHFLLHSASSVNFPSLLILDGHSTHTRNIEVIDLARDNGVTLLVLPPHCSHRLQPLDVAYMKPLSTYYNRECEKWLRSHPGRVITTFQVGALFGAAYLKASTPESAINGFSKAGIFPLNRDVFTDVDFAPSDVTDQTHKCTAHSSTSDNCATNAAALTVSAPSPADNEEPSASTVSTQQPANDEEPPALTVSTQQPANSQEPPALTVSTQQPANSQEPPVLTVSAPPPANNEELPALTVSIQQPANSQEPPALTVSAPPQPIMKNHLLWLCQHHQMPLSSKHTPR